MQYLSFIYYGYNLLVKVCCIHAHLLIQCMPTRRCQLLRSTALLSHLQLHRGPSTLAQVQFKGVTLYDCGTKYTPRDYRTNPRCTVVPPSGVQDKLSTPVSA